MTDPSQLPDLMQRVLAEIRADRKIEAIKLLREHLGLDLASAKRLVDELAAGGETTITVTGTDGDAEADAASLARVAQLVHQGQKIEAIKLLRDLNPGLSLANAKQAVESMEAGRPVTFTTSWQTSDDTHGHDEIVRLLAGGRKIEAIKRMRELYPEFDLAEAKDAVETLEREARSSPAESTPPVVIRPSPPLSQTLSPEAPSLAQRLGPVGLIAVFAAVLGAGVACAAVAVWVQSLLLPGG